MRAGGPDLTQERASHEKAPAGPDAPAGRSGISISDSPLAVSLAAAFILVVLGGGLLPRLLDSDPALRLAGQIAGNLFQWFGIFVAVAALGRSLLAKHEVEPDPVADQQNAIAVLPADVGFLLNEESRQFFGHEWSIDLVQALEWRRFELLVIGYFEAKGFAAEVLSIGGEEGRDILLRRNPGEAPAAVVQCKAWTAHNIGVRYVRELVGAMVQRKIRRGILFAKMGFTPDAVEMGGLLGVRLISGEMLLSGVMALPKPVQESLREIATRGDFSTPSCPACDVKMIRRAGEFGDFWGCRNYPRCKVRLFPENFVSQPRRHQPLLSA